MTGLTELRIPAPRSPLADRLAQFDLKPTGDTIIDGCRLHIATVSAKLAASEAELATVREQFERMSNAADLIARLEQPSI
jgi:hypothetical protein